MVQLAVAEKVDFVLIVGDLYDRDWKEYNTGLYFLSQMSKLREAEILVSSSQVTTMLRAKSLRPFGFPKVLTFFVKQAWHISYRKNERGHPRTEFFISCCKKNLSAKYHPRLKDCFNIGVLHTCATGRVGHEPYAPCKIENLQSKGYDYWAFGHIHQQMILPEDPLVFFPWNSHRRYVRETGPKGCMLVEVDNRGRAMATLKVLAALSKKTQVIFFTHHRHLVELAEASIDLGLLVKHTLDGPH